jgi:hypothetical protein
MAAARSPGRASREDDAPWSILGGLVARAVGGRDRADAVIYDALAASPLSASPSGEWDVFVFLQAHLFPLLVRAVGPRVAAEVVEAFESKLARRHEDAPSEPPRNSDVRKRKRAPRSPPPVSGSEARPLALIVTVDTLERSGLARALVREGVDMRSAESIAELEELLTEGAPLRLAVIDTAHPKVEDILAALARAWPGLPVVARATNGFEAARAVCAAGLDLVAVYEPRDRGAAELVAASIERATRTTPVR